MPAPSLPLFQPSPRTFPTIPTQEVEIQAPPPAPSRPTSSLLTVILPLVFVFVGLGLSVFFIGTNPSYLLLSVPLMLGSGLTGILSYSNERKKYRQEVERRQQNYLAYLADTHRILQELADQQHRASLEIHPDFAACLAIARRAHPEDARHLWERSSGLSRPRDPDFLHLRLGTGRLPAAFKVKPPASRPQVGERDELYERAVQLARDFQQVDGVAIPLPLSQVGSAGLAGPRSAVLETARALLVSLATLHAPNEVKIVALLPAAERHEWDWLRWLPHVWDDERKQRYLAASPDEARQMLAELFPLLQKRALARSPSADEKSLFPQTYVFLFADPALYTTSADTSVIGPLTYLLLTQGASIGAYSLFLNDRVEALPGACGAVVDLSSGRGRLFFSAGYQTVEHLFSPDRVDAARAESFARALAPVRLKPLAAQSDLPSRLTLLDLLKVRTVDDVPLETWWGQRDSHRSLEVPLGVESGGGVAYLNFQDTSLGGDGSHAMIGGTTGTGKTRFLQTLILLTAAHHHPHDVNFILIDYKGGDLLQGLEDLPHVVGTLANLEKQSTQAVLIERLFVCLEAELRRRRNLLGGRNINDYQKDHLQSRQPEPLPHLFVVIDEFAEMIRNSPDKATMTKRLLSIGATGRSLGVHLVLATQDPSGVVNDELRNNINSRVCLRMGSREASTAILRRPDAFENITSAQVGRAYLQVGNDDRFTLFQVAWGGDPYHPSQGNTGWSLYEVDLRGRRVPLRRFQPLTQQTHTQLNALADHVIQTARRLGLARLKSPLSPPLREIIYLDELLPSTPWDGSRWNPTAPDDWLAPVIGQLDDPANQTQPPLRLPLAQEGHFALYGEPGSGKTAFVQTLVTSLVLTHSPADLHLYLLDFSGQRLLLLKDFPHVGDVFLSDDLERLKRFFRYLKREVQERKSKFAHLGVSTLADYRSLSGESLPALVIVLEDYATFNKIVMNLAPDLDDDLASLVKDGGGYGLHFVFTLTAPSELKPRLANAISLSATFRLATPDYSMAIGPTGGMTPAPLPGRGLVRGPLEFQTALAVRGQNDAERTLALKRLMEQMSQAWTGPRPRAFAPLPAVLGLSQVLPPQTAWPDPPPPGFVARFALLYDDPDQPFDVRLSDGPYFLIAGTPQSGKTTALQSWVLSLAESCSPERLRLCLVDYRQSGLLPLSELPHVRRPLPEKRTSRQRGEPRHITGEAAFSDLLAELVEVMRQREEDLNARRAKSRAAFDLRAWQASQPAILMVMDDFDLFQSDTQEGVKSLFDAHLKKWRELGFYLIVAGSISDLENAWGWIAQLRNQAVGLQLGSAAYNNVFKLNLPTDMPAKTLSPGDGYYIRRGQFWRLKLADPSVGPLPLPQWVEQLAKR